VLAQEDSFHQSLKVFAWNKDFNLYSKKVRQKFFYALDDKANEDLFFKTDQVTHVVWDNTYGISGRLLLFARYLKDATRVFSLFNISRDFLALQEAIVFDPWIPIMNDEGIKGKKLARANVDMDMGEKAQNASQRQSLKAVIVANVYAFLYGDELVCRLLENDAFNPHINLGEGEKAKLQEDMDLEIIGQPEEEQEETLQPGLLDALEKEKEKEKGQEHENDNEGEDDDDLVFVE